jgi:hypothetical protein
MREPNYLRELMSGFKVYYKNDHTLSITVGEKATNPVTGATLKIDSDKLAEQIENLVMEGTWKIEGNRLIESFPDGDVDTLELVSLSKSQLDFKHDGIEFFYISIN